MRMDLAQREVAIHVAEGVAVAGPQLPDDQLQGAGVGTFVVAVDQDRHRPRSTDVVVFLDNHRHTVSFANSWRNAGWLPAPSPALTDETVAGDQAFSLAVFMSTPI